MSDWSEGKDAEREVCLHLVVPFDETSLRSVNFK